MTILAEVHVSWNSISIVSEGKTWPSSFQKHEMDGRICITTQIHVVITWTASMKSHTCHNGVPTIKADKQMIECQSS